MIIDYDEDKGNDGDQSDIVSIALNLAFVKDFETLKNLVDYGNKGIGKDDGLKLTPVFKTLEEIEGYEEMEDPDKEEKLRKAQEKKEKAAKRAALK